MVPADLLRLPRQRSRLDQPTEKTMKLITFIANNVVAEMVEDSLGLDPSDGTLCSSARCISRAAAAKQAGAGGAAAADGGTVPSSGACSSSAVSSGGSGGSSGGSEAKAPASDDSDACARVKPKYAQLGGNLVVQKSLARFHATLALTAA